MNVYTLSILKYGEYTRNMENPFKTIISVRHTETDFNINEQVQDDITPTLTEKGKLQAQALSEKIKQMGKIGMVICADTTRTIETLSIIYPDYENMEHVEISADLNERYHTELAGNTKKEINDLVDPYDGRFSWQLYFEGTDKSVLTDKFPENETLDKVEERVKRIVEKIRSSPHNTILLIGSSIINHYLLEVFGLGTIGKSRITHPETNEELDFQKNDELRIIEIDDQMTMKNFHSEAIEY